MITLDTDNLKEIIETNDAVVVQYGASWCGNCRMVRPKFEAYSKEKTDVTFVYVDAEKFPESRKLAQVDNLPTFAYFKGGQFQKQTQGNKIDLVKELIA